MSRRTVGWLLVILQGVLLVAIVLVPHRAPTLLSLLAGAVLGAAAIVLGVLAFTALGGALTPTPVPREEAGLRTTGPYRVVRHPIYTAALLAVFAFTIAAGSWWTVAVALLLVVFFLAKSRWEDALLREKYDVAWREWAATTGGLVPRRSPRAG